MMKKNVDRISTRSIASGEIKEQQSLLDTAERKLAKMGQHIERIRVKILELRRQAVDARRQHKEQGTTKTKRALTSVLKKLDAALEQRDMTLSDSRELKLVVREQRAVCRSLERKEEARQKAVAVFLKEWERSYDREVRMKAKNIRKRNRMGGM